MASKARTLPNEPPPRPIIIKKITAEAHAGHHGGAWKIAYADFVTAMMAFFLLMWLLGMSDEEKRKGLADYFAPTLIAYRSESSGANGIMAGESIIGRDAMPNRPTQTGNRAIVVPHGATGGSQEATPNAPMREDRFVGVRQQIERAIWHDPSLREAAAHVRFTMTDDGMRIDLVDNNHFSMFLLSTADLNPAAQRLVTTITRSIAQTPGTVIIRGHTDARPYAGGSAGNNWTLSADRAEATRQVMIAAGLPPTRVARIEGAADREPLVDTDPMDPRNRRIAISLGR